MRLVPARALQVNKPEVVMKNIIRFLLSCLLLNSIMAFAYTETKMAEPIVNPDSLLKQAKVNPFNMQFDISEREQKVKAAIKSKKVELDSYASDSQALSYQKEINSPYSLNKIEKAKVLARFLMTKAISERWSELSMTILNTTNTKNFLDFRIPLSDLIENKLLYSRSYLPMGKDKVVHEFEFEEIALIRIRDDLKLVDYIFEINSLPDSNRLDPAAKKITIAE